MGCDLSVHYCFLFGSRTTPGKYPILPKNPNFNPDLSAVDDVYRFAVFEYAITEITQK